MHDAFAEYRSWVTDAFEIADLRISEICDREINEWLLNKAIAKMSQLNHPDVTKMSERLDRHKDRLLVYLARGNQLPGQGEAMSSEWHIRPAREEDNETMHRVVREALPFAPDLNWRRFLVVEDNTMGIIGCGQVIRYRRVLELGSLAVHPECRGQGIGSALVEALVQREKGDIYLTCQERLICYYERFGFKRSGGRNCLEC